MKLCSSILLAAAAFAAPSSAHAVHAFYFSPPPLAPVFPCPVGYWTCAYQSTVCYVPQWRVEPVETIVPRMTWKQEKVRTRVAGYVPKKVDEKRVVYAVRYEPKVVDGAVTYDVITEPRNVVIPTIKYEPEIREVDTIRWTPEWRNEKIITYRYACEWTAVPTVKPVYGFVPVPYGVWGW